MYIDIVPNRASPPAILLRESVREGAKTRKRTVANLSSLEPAQVVALRAILRGETLVAPSDAFEKLKDRQHGACEAIRIAMRRLGFESLLEARRSRERDLVVAMVAARILQPRSKLATSRSWSRYTLCADLGVDGANEKELYSAMDWLLERQARVEKKLAARHLRNGSLALYDLSSSYFEGETCPLAKLGHSRDGKKGTLQVNYGLLTNAHGVPVSISVYPGNTGDSTTVMPQLEKLRGDFGLSDVVLVGDRGMISQKQIDQMKPLDGVAWITALRTERIKGLVECGAIQIGLFDEKNLFEITHEDYPGERLVACRNPELAKRRAHKRESLLAATEAELLKVKKSVEKGRLEGAAKIGLRVGKVVGKYKVQKHFVLEITDDAFTFSRDAKRIREEAALDGIYVVRTSLTKELASAADAVRSYKKLARVERAFRTIKTTDLQVRPIHHRLEGRVRAHILLCMLAYYVERHMRDALAPMLFADEMSDDEKDERDPVAPALRSAAALRKARTKRLVDSSPAHDFRSLLGELELVVRSTCRPRAAKNDAPTFDVVTSLNPIQQRAFVLLAEIPTYPVR
jgi:transposase